MCRLCGREACAECFEQVKDLTEDRPGATQADIAALQAKREKHAHTNPFFLSCTRRNEHIAKDFSPMSRFCKAELAQAMKEMEEMLAQPDMYALPGVGAIDPSLQNGQSGAAEATNGNGAGPSNSSGNEVIPPQASSLVGDGQGVGGATSIATGTEQQSSSQQETTLGGVPELPSHSTITIADSELTEDVFRPLWERGEPIVVTGLLSKFKIQWTPEYFTQKYNSQSCLILECQSDINKRVTVGEFFSWFGKYEGRTECWKLKASQHVITYVDAVLTGVLRTGLRRLTSRLCSLSFTKISVELFRYLVTSDVMEHST